MAIVPKPVAEDYGLIEEQNLLRNNLVEVVGANPCLMNPVTLRLAQVPIISV